MKIFELSHIGQFHTNHNEDYLLLAELGKNRQLAAVMDGCSSGTDSHFAATLIGKLLRRLAKEESYRVYIEKDSPSLSHSLELISLQLFEELGQLSRRLDLQADEVLSTMILAIVDTKSCQAELVVVGDGVICIDREIIEYDNDNKPDYIGYHLNMDKREWYKTKTTRKSVSSFTDMTISTDGIFTFKNFDDKSYSSIYEEQIMTAFFTDLSELSNPNKLKKVLHKIKADHGLLPTDDLTMIRMVAR